MRLAVLATMAMMTAACSHRVNVSYTAPADVGLPGDVETVLVVNRALPKNAGESVLDAAEGWVTGEGFETDHDTSELALDGLVTVLQQTDRYDVVEVHVGPKAADSSLFDRKLDTKVAKRLCRKHDCDAIVSLDSLDTDTQATVTRTRDGHTGRTDTSMNASFRVYDGTTGHILDEARLGGALATEDTDDDFEEAMVAASQGSNLQADLSFGAGLEYGRRIAPHDVVSLRPYYTTGNADLRAAKRAVNAGNWKGAKAIWQGLVEGDDAKLAAKARYNLALAAEVAGNLERARTLARKANAQWSNGRNRRYITALTDRIAQQERLDEQMARTPRAAPKPSPKAAPKATLDARS